MLFRSQTETSFWIIDDNNDVGFSSIGSNTQPKKYTIRSIEVYEELNRTEIIVYDDDNNITLSSAYPSFTSLKIVSNFFNIDWKSGIFMNGILEGDFEKGIWLNGVFVDGEWGI